MPSNELTDKQKRFVEEYLVDLNATQAAIRAGYSERTARKIGQENLTKPDIAAAIREAQEARSDRTEITQDKVLQELARIGFSDVTNYLMDDLGRLQLAEGAPDDAMRAVASVKHKKRVVPRKDNEPEVVYELEFKLWDKNTALANIGKHLGMFTDRGVNIDLDSLTDEELRRIANGEDPISVIADARRRAA
jgi:phage terminase small subunit